MEDKAERTVEIKVMDYSYHNRFAVEMKRSTEFGKLMRKYADAMIHAPGIFQFRYRGKIIKPADTPDSLNMPDIAVVAIAMAVIAPIERAVDLSDVDEDDEVLDTDMEEESTDDGIDTEDGNDSDEDIDNEEHIETDDGIETDAGNDTEDGNESDGEDIKYGVGGHDIINYFADIPRDIKVVEAELEASIQQEENRKQDRKFDRLLGNLQ